MLTGRLLKNGMGYSSALASFFCRSASAFGSPVSIAIEPTNICNLKCPLCAAGAEQLSRLKGHMKFGDFQKIIDRLPPSVTDLYLWGQGEPFLVRDFTSMVRYASERGFKTIVSTNGHFLDNAETIAASGLGCLIVSLDGAERETYESYRSGGDFNRVVNGIRRVAEAKKSIDCNMAIELQFLVTRKNAGERKKIISLADKIGADRVVFKTLQAVSIENGESYLPENIKHTRYRKTESGMIETDRNWLLGNRCLRLYYSCQIDWQGNVLPCCFDKDSEHILGNVFEQDIAAIWNSENYRSFRTMLNKNGRVLPMCRDCTEGLKRKTLHD